jgi:hypothetical protein
MNLPLGKRPARYDPSTIRYADIRPTAAGSLPSIPKPSGGYGADFADWLMLGNGPCDDGTVPESWYAYNGAGDCAWAGPGHEEMEGAKNDGRPVPAFSCLNILNQYAEYLGLSGAERLTKGNDAGSDVQQVLQWRQSKGLKDAHGNMYKIGPFVSLEPGNTQQLWEALWLFDCVGIGINFPQSAMDQFNAGHIWSVVPGTQIEGGHYIPLVGHPTERVWTCVTWGKRQTMTEQFLTTYCDEAYAYVDPEKFSAATGKSPQGFTATDLTAYLQKVAQQTPAGT